MKKAKLTVTDMNMVRLYQKDCLFSKECILVLVKSDAPNGHQHIRTQCSTCGYQTGGSVSKKTINPLEKVRAFNKRLYNAVYKKKLEEVYAMTGENQEVIKRVQQIKKAYKSGKLVSLKKRISSKLSGTASLLT